VREELRRVYAKGVSLKEAARLMRENGLKARRRGKSFFKTLKREMETLEGKHSAGRLDSRRSCTLRQIIIASLTFGA
jgi:transposase InsO family protein